jgi:hypothetical protein
MNTIRAFIGAVLIAIPWSVACCAAEVSEADSAGEARSEPDGAAPSSAAVTDPRARPIEYVGRPADSTGTSCYRRCVSSRPGDPSAVAACRCICAGKPDETCFVE